MELRFYIRQYQYVNYLGSPIIWTGSNPSSLTPTSGTVDNIWHDFTPYVINLDMLKLQWTVELSDNAGSIAGGYNPKKAASGTLKIDGLAYDYVRAWLVDHVAAPLNSIEVKIQDVGCGYYESYQFKSTQLAWCETDACEFDINLKQLDDQYSCIQKTIISDNWQGWFQTIPDKGKKHPRFSYCNEHRPNGTLVMTWWIIAMMEILFAPLIAIILAIYDAIAIILNAVLSIINFLSFNSVSINLLPVPDPLDAFTYFQTMMIESCGCGREHPAPLIRDYITNVCDRCGLKVDAVTAPIFFAKNISINTSGGYLSNVFNPHYNACYFFAPIKRGIRRNTRNSLLYGVALNDTDFYIEENKPIYALSDFLDLLKHAYNHEWRIKAGYLYFWRKDWYNNVQFIYDFTDNAADHEKILEGVCFEWSEIKYPAYVTGLYSQDPVDTCANEALDYMNQIYSFDITANNPNFDGELNKSVPQLGGTKFRLDGAATDYIYDTMQVVGNGAALAPPLFYIFKDLDSALAEIANYVLLMKDENCGLGKILIWDEENYMNAKCIRNMVPVNNSLVPPNAGNPIPSPNMKYPLYDSKNNNAPYYSPWITYHPAKTDIKGHALVPGGSEPGVYEVKNYGGSLIAHNAARLVNYPMYFDPHYLGTMWDWFHFIDDPRFNPQMNMSWNLKIELCCDDLKKLKVLGDATDIELLSKVKLPFHYYPEGIITEIGVSYDSSDRLGKYISLKGKM